MDTLDAVAEKIQSSFEKSCNNSVNTIENSVHNSIGKLNNEVDQSISKFNEKVKLELDGISSTHFKLKICVRKKFRTVSEILILLLRPT